MVVYLNCGNLHAWRGNHNGPCATVRHAMVVNPRLLSSSLSIISSSLIRFCFFSFLYYFSIRKLCGVCEALDLATLHFPRGLLCQACLQVEFGFRILLFA